MRHLSGLVALQASLTVLSCFAPWIAEATVPPAPRDTATIMEGTLSTLSHISTADDGAIMLFYGPAFIDSARAQIDFYDRNILNAPQRSLSITPGVTGIFDVQPGGAVTVVADSALVVSLSYKSLSDSSKHSVTRLFSRDMARQLGSWTFSDRLRGTTSADGRIWVVEGGDSVPSHQLPRLRSFDLAANYVNISLALPSGSTDIIARDLAGCPDGSVVVLLETRPFGLRLRRYSASGGLLAGDVVLPSLARTTRISCDAAGMTYAADERIGGGPLYMYDYDLNLVATYATGSDGLSPLTGPVYGNDLDCRLFAGSTALGLKTDEFPAPIRVLSTDADGDGVCDTWETHGLRYVGAGSPLILPEAKVLRKDLYLEVDAMDGHELGDSAATALVGAFAAVPTILLPQPIADTTGGIALHLDLASLHQHLPHEVWNDKAVSQRFFAFKRKYFGDPGDSGNVSLLRARALVWRYAASVHSLDTAVSNNRTGQSEMSKDRGVVHGGNDCVLGFTADEDDPDHYAVANIRAAVLMHEFGHLLGLQHGGIDSVDDKPEYRSVMNYRYQFPPIPAFKIPQSEWRLDYNRHSYPPISERSLHEHDGFGGPPRSRLHVNAGPPVATFGSDGSLKTCRPFIYPERGKVDLNLNGLYNDIVSKNITLVPDDSGKCDTSSYANRRRDTYDSLFAVPDWPHIQMGSRYWRSWRLDSVLDFLGMTPRTEPRMWNSSRLISGPSDCNGDGIPDSLQILAGALDVDHNGLLDKYCDAYRIDGLADAITACPAGELGALSFTLDMRDVAVVNIHDPTLRICAAWIPGLSDTIWTWRAGRGVCVLDTLWATSYDTTAKVATFSEARLMGCGEYWFRLLANGSVIVDSTQVRIHSVDYDKHSIGTVDQLDYARTLSAFFAGSGEPCADVDNSGSVSVNDVGLVGLHQGHHIPRAVLSPNGGDTLGWGEFYTHRWAPGRGDSALVSFYLLRDGVPGWERLLGQDLSDDGSELWPEYPSDARQTDYRLKVVHTVGLLRSNNQFGSDISDATYTVDDPPGGGGCPLLATKTNEGWSDENTILGRSLDGGFGLDACRLRWATATDSVVQLKIRENELESTRLDEVRLVAIDHRPEVRAYATGDRVLLGTPVPALSVRTSSGTDITTSLGDGGGGFSAAASETLFVRLAGNPVRPGLRANPSGGDDPFLFDDGGGKGGGVPQNVARPASASRSDAQVLGSTGILVQAMQGGVWTTLAHRYPREYPSDALCDSVRVDSVRMVFLDGHPLRWVGSLQESGDTVIAVKLQPRSALHSRLGDVTAAVVTAGNVTTSIDHGDTLTLVFGNPPIVSGMVREYFLLSRGVYTTNLPASPRPVDLPVKFALFQNQPNPFAGPTNIVFDVPQAAKVRITVFDLQGRRVRHLADATYSPGHYSVGWNLMDDSGTRVRAGVYIYRMEADAFRNQKKMILLP